MHKMAFSRYTTSINIWEMKHMFDIMKAVRETAAARSAVTRARRPRPELIRLRVEIERTNTGSRQEPL